MLPIAQGSALGQRPVVALRALMGYALSARGIFASAQKCRMYQSRSTFPQGVALGYGQHLGLQPAPIIYRTFVQIGWFLWPTNFTNLHEFTFLAINGDLVGRTNLTNFRASECRAEFIRAMPSAAENLKVNFRAIECRAELVRAMPSAAENLEAKISKQIFVQASTELNLIEICRAQPKILN